MPPSPADPLRRLLAKRGMFPGAEPERVQRKLLDYLGSLVRVASRRGVAQPALLRWLRQQPKAETEELVRRLARLLLAPERGAGPVAETVLAV